MDALLSIAVGIGLASACGMRVFLPLLAMSIAAHTGVLHPSGPMEWLGSWTALLALTTASCAEIVGYYIPWVDHALDVLATPLATLAGSLAAMTVMLPADTHLTPGWQWAGALLGGGSAAGSVQLLTVGVRAASTASTGGLANPVVATAENVGAATFSIMFLITPLIGLVLFLAAAFLAYRWFIRPKKGVAAAVPAYSGRRSWFGLRGWKRSVQAPLNQAARS